MPRLPTLATTLALATAALLAPAAQALEVQGTWVGVVDLPGNVANPAGQKLPFIAQLAQKDDRVTGLLDGVRGTPGVVISNGKVSGGTLTLNGVRGVRSSRAGM